MKDIMRRLADARPDHLSGEGPPDEALRRMELGRAFAKTRTARRRGGRRMLLVPAAVAGVACVTALALTINSGSAPQVAKPNAISLNDKFMFLAAADRAALLPMGAYWQRDQITGRSYLVKSGYAITGAHAETYEWTSVKPGGGERFYQRDLPARPLTAADEAAWRRAGSPSSFRVFSNDHYATYTTKAGSWQSDDGQARSGGRFFLPGRTPEEGMTLAQMGDLPTDPAALAQMFFRPTPIDSEVAKRYPAVVAWENNPARQVLLAAEAFAEPLSPKVRAGLMRALAVQPGVRSFGTVTDPLGRQGIAIGADWPDTEPIYDAPAKVKSKSDVRIGWKRVGDPDREELIFDARTGAYLGEMTVLVKPGAEYATRAPGFVLNYVLTRDSGWTDRKPAPPKSLPFP